MIDGIKKYSDHVLKGKIITGDLIKSAIKRNNEDLKRVKDRSFPYYFNENAALKMINFAQLCRHHKGKFAGQRIKLELNQVFYLAVLFGWLKKSDHTRRFRTSAKFVARKNGKTTESAVKSLFHVSMDGEPGAQTWVGATKEDQARIAVNDAGQIVLSTPELKSRFELFKKKDQVTRVFYPKNASFIAPLGRDSNTQDGFHASLGIIDEYHAHPTDGLLNVIESSMGGRRQPLMDVITTAGFNRQLPCYKNLRARCLRMLKGEVEDNTLFAMIFELDDTDDWKDMDMWGKANPNLGASLDLTYLQERFESAVNEGSSKEVEFKTKNLNYWTDSSAVWIQTEVWKKNHYNLKISDLAGRDCYLGLDLAKSVDLNAAVLFFPDVLTRKDGKPVHACLFFFWMPDAKLKKNTDGVDYNDWVNRNFIHATDGNVVDHRFLIKTILELAGNYHIVRGCYDRYLATHGVVQELTSEGLDLYEFSQGITSVSPYTKLLEELAVETQLEHFNNPVISWMMSNVELNMDANGNIQASKKKSQNKIDGVAALVNAIAAWRISEAEIEEDFGIDYITL